MAPVSSSPLFNFAAGFPPWSPASFMLLELFQYVHSISPSLRQCFVHLPGSYWSLHQTGAVAPRMWFLCLFVHKYFLAFGTEHTLAISGGWGWGEESFIELTSGGKTPPKASTALGDTPQGGWGEVWCSPEHPNLAAEGTGSFLVQDVLPWGGSSTKNSNHESELA